MKQRAGFVSNSSSSSFVLNKDCMTDKEIEEFLEQMESADRYDTIGETDNFFFGMIDYSDKFCEWLEMKKFKKIEWG
jgi:hypothetical protein